MRKQEYLTPSGLKFVLREQTGEDDELLNAAQSEVDMINTYLAAVVVEGATGSEGVKKLRLGDKYFLIIASRILSLGPTLHFSYQWAKGREPIEYTEDLEQYLWDYTKPFPEPGDPEYFSQRIRPYPDTEFIEGQLGDWKIRMDYLDGVGEAYLMNLPENRRTVNSDLVARNLRYFDKEWKIVKSFASFSARDMVYIRNLANEGDPPIEGLTSFTDPVTGQTLSLPLIGIKDFFFPVKI